jgi:hypothetical protein
VQRSQGVYVASLSRALARLGHEVEVFSGQPYPELDPDVVLTRVPSLDLYRRPDPFRTPDRREFRDLIDVLGYAIMAAGGSRPNRGMCGCWFFRLLTRLLRPGALCQRLAGPAPS